MVEKQPNTELNIEKRTSKNVEKEMDLVNILFRIIGIRKTLYKAAGVGLVIGLIVALSIPKQYTVKVTLSPEMGNQKGTNGLAGLAASFLGNGATMGENPDALNISLSGDIVSSTPFLLGLLDIDVTTEKSHKMILKSYLDEQRLPWWNYLMEMPNIIIDGVKSLFSDQEKDIQTILNQGTLELAPKDAAKIKYLKSNVIALMDQKTAITEIYVTLQNPKVAAVVADSVARKLQEYIINYRTSKAKDDCGYLEMLFKERQQEYYIAQNKYANYVDAHDNLVLQSVRASQERLQNDMNLAYQVYSQVANQLQVARAKVQEEKPVFAVVEPAVIPQHPSGMGLKIYVLLFMFLSVVCAVVWILAGKDFLKRLRSEEKRTN